VQWGNERLELIESAKLLPGLTDAMRETISITSTIFDDTIPTMQRVLFLGAAKQLVRLHSIGIRAASLGPLRLGSP